MLAASAAVVMDLYFTPFSVFWFLIFELQLWNAKQTSQHSRSDFFRDIYVDDGGNADCW